MFKHALLLEDEQNLAKSILIALEDLKIKADHSSTLAEARQAIYQQQDSSAGYDLIILDRNLPDGDGLELCAQLRKDNFGVPILVLTAVGDVEERVRGLDAGADDYLPKPFSWEEFSARIRALQRRAPVQSSTEKWLLNGNTLQVFGPNGWIKLTPLEFKLASRLIKSQGATLHRDELLKKVWGFTLLPKTRTVDYFMGKLRKHFELDPDQPRHFLTVRGAGYRFEP